MVPKSVKPLEVTISVDGSVWCHVSVREDLFCERSCYPLVGYMFTTSFLCHGKSRNDYKFVWYLLLRFICYVCVFLFTTNFDDSSLDVKSLSFQKE